MVFGRQACIGVVVAAAGGFWAAHGESIGVNFCGKSQKSGRVTAEGRAGAPGFEQTRWNNLSGVFPNDPNVPAGDDPANLKDSSGKGTKTSAVWLVENTWTTAGPSGTDTERLRRYYLDSNHTEASQVEVALSGIPYYRYTLVVYMDADGVGRAGSVKADGREIHFLTQGNGGAPLARATAATPEEAKTGSYAVFTGIRGDTLAFQVKGAAGRNVGLQGFQVVEEPE